MKTLATLIRLIAGTWVASLAGLVCAQGVGPNQVCEDEGWLALAPGIHIWQPAPDQDVSSTNGGHVVPTTVLLHNGVAWVIDPGPSLNAGLRLKSHIACRWQARVERVFNTHAHAENVLANVAFLPEVKAGQVSIASTLGTRNAMSKRCPDCLADLAARVGPKEMAGTNYVVPDAVLSAGEVLRLGPHELRVYEVEAAHTFSDLVLVHESARIAWVGGLVYGQRLPELAQGSLIGWLKALAWLRQTQWTALVGTTFSKSPSDGVMPDALMQTEAYLMALQTVVLEAMEAGLQVSEIPPEMATPFATWAGYSKRHGFNLQRAWRELEPGWMDGLLKPAH